MVNTYQITILILTSQTSRLLLEAMYTIKEDQESTFRIFGGFKTWYEMATSYDDSIATACIQKIAIITNSRKNLTT